MSGIRVRAIDGSSTLGRPQVRFRARREQLEIFQVSRLTYLGSPIYTGPLAHTLIH